MSLDLEVDLQETVIVYLENMEDVPITDVRVLSDGDTRVTSDGEERIVELATGKDIVFEVDLADDVINVVLE